MNKMTIKPSIPLYLSLKCQGEEWRPGHALPAAWRSSPPALLASLRGPLAVISALCLPMEVFLWNRGLPLVLWL